MVRYDVKGLRESFKIVPPVFKCADNGEHLLVIQYISYVNTKLVPIVVDEFKGYVVMILSIKNIVAWS